MPLKLCPDLVSHYILSEGEHRAVAIGAFLAEVNLSENKGGVVFDDPVSSLDHSRRESVARRLVLEATKRQVVILTHDIYFTCLLMEEAKLANTDILTMSLHQTVDGYGVPNLELPFQGKNTKQRIGSLKDLHQRIDKLYREGDIENYEELTTDAYRRLRITWERAVEEVLFQNVIVRFRKSIETNRLRGVTVEHVDFHEMNQGMTRCSNFAPHDRASISGSSTPKPDELLNDIKSLESWRDRILRRIEETEKLRKM
jgi:energy-coupling factor transporter ATP-binding protein EcfA2